MDLSTSISNSLSKGGLSEEMSLASLEEAASRQQDTISNEQIRKGDPILDTYEVISDAISGGMGIILNICIRSKVINF